MTTTKSNTLSLAAKELVGALRAYIPVLALPVACPDRATQCPALCEAPRPCVPVFPHPASRGEKAARNVAAPGSSAVPET